MKTRISALAFLLVPVLGACGDEGGEATEIVAFSALPTDIEPGGVVTLSWETRGAKTVQIFGYVGEAQEGAGLQIVGQTSSTSGTVIDTPGRTIRYVLYAEGDDEVEAEKTVNVSSSPADIQINTFLLSPTLVAPNEPSTLAWATANAQDVQIDHRPYRPDITRDDLNPWARLVGPADRASSQDVQALVSTEYRLTARGNVGGEDRVAYRTIRLTVEGERPDRPRILSLVVEPPVITVGDTALIIWETELTESVFFSPEIGHPIALVNGEWEIDPVRSTEFEMTATRDGLIDVATVSIEVNPAAEK